MKKKALALVLAVAIMTVGVVGVTLAWLHDKTDTVTNVFTTAGIDVELTETPNYDSNNDGTDDCWKAQLIPGKEYAKDPVVTVKKNSVDCYLFVKFEEVNSPATYLDYTSNLTTENGWTKLTGVSGVNNVWYREVTSSTSDQSWRLLNGDKITVRGTVTADNMATAATAELKYTAYASQLMNNNTKFTPVQAWGNIAE